jgi:hypothetical protein
MSLEMAHKVIVPPKKNYIPQFLKQRDINSYFPPSKNVITSLTLGSELSSLLFVKKTCRVSLLQGGQIYCPTLLIPEMGKETFFKGGV